MMRRVLSIVLLLAAFLLAVPAQAQNLAQTVRSLAHSLKAPNPTGIDLVLASDERVASLLGAIEEDRLPADAVAALLADRPVMGLLRSYAPDLRPQFDAMLPAETFPTAHLRMAGECGQRCDAVLPLVDALSASRELVGTPLIAGVSVPISTEVQRMQSIEMQLYGRPKEIQLRYESTPEGEFVIYDGPYAATPLRGKLTAARTFHLQGDGNIEHAFGDGWETATFRVGGLVHEDGRIDVRGLRYYAVKDDGLSYQRESFP